MKRFFRLLSAALMLAALPACSALPAGLHAEREHYPLGCPDNLFMRRFLPLKMQMPGKKRSKIGHLARLFNAAGAFSGAKSTRKSNCPDTLGRSSVHIVRYCTDTPEPGILFYHPHENETTAKKTTAAALAERGKGCLLALEHRASRRIVIESANSRADFDPNRIYTEAGRRATLARSRAGTDAENTTAAFARYLLTHHLNPQRIIIAVHNNSNGGTDIRSYLSGMLGHGSAEVYINPARDPDDYFFTTDRRAFSFFKARGFNIVRQNSLTVHDDGSLSVYAARHGIGYINVEAEHGHRAAQTEMLYAVFEYLAEP
ncbi:hypothetical protein LVJ83_00135 [Uruburuella testudinis]|uniref:MurNAc-LAA domain-containing protein n=1 Tax=Uruburuella testudinis TaxID=1282863 RepID=A0ABY4DST4_9NEIS|nr:hypothetical protein [Uruburuella testudinis]UOO81926.1 hypothetical protein LVJ83_00135 [Uruburuella testudinis]